MGCATSDRKDASQRQRDKMLVEYLKGVESKPLKEVVHIPERNNINFDIPDNLRLGDVFTAPDRSEFKIISENSYEIELLCLSCNKEIVQSRLKDHLKSAQHIDLM
ncbi:hypothetical protein SteCoe_36403 [Stentor coeruleus]|uniref:Uncharacterized protein n=1 Tax=Stentor coeruleus TaxID=5963 RepID=A0A1R2AQ80_9CILI|nr:hypothetical protein SteCoe_36403 [Stentor coeruleus]